jgi:sec-independent protein translocase protein TatB
MFDHVGWSELIVLAIVGLLVLGPDRLRQLRGMARNATADLKAELGPEMADLDLASLHPRRIVQSALWDDEEPYGAAGVAPLAPGEPPPYDADAT